MLVPNTCSERPCHVALLLQTAKTARSPSPALHQGLALLQLLQLQARRRWLLAWPCRMRRTGAVMRTKVGALGWH
jgi:hypothetical protein